MNTIEQIQKEYEIGLPILESFYNLKKPELIEKLKSVLSYERALQVLEDNPGSYKTMENDIPKEVVVAVWDMIEINAWGIYFKPEHGTSKQIIKFNEHFKF